MELIPTSGEVPLLQFYKIFIKKNNQSDGAIFKIVNFVSKYICKHVFYLIKTVKSKASSHVTD